MQTFLWSAWGDLWAHRFTGHENDEPESHFSHCRIFKTLVEHFKARTNTIFHQLKAGHLPNVADTMPFWLKKAVCNPKQSLVSLEGSCGPCYLHSFALQWDCGILAVTTGPLGELCSAPGARTGSSSMSHLLKAAKRGSERGITLSGCSVADLSASQPELFLGLLSRLGHCQNNLVPQRAGRVPGWSC